MKIKRLYKWQLYLIAFIIAFTSFILGAVLATFLYMKNIDIKGIRKDHEYLKRQYERLKKKEALNNSVSDYIDTAKTMTDYNEDAVIVPGEGGK